MFSVMLITNLFIFWVVLTGTLRRPLIATFDFFLVQIFFLQLYVFFFKIVGANFVEKKKNIKITKRISFMSFFIYLIFLLNRTHFSTTLTVTYACLLTFAIVEDKQTS